MARKAKPTRVECVECRRMTDAAAKLCEHCGACLPKPFKRAGLHRLECPECPCYGYFTVAMLEALGEMPGCLARDCGGILEPAEAELAALLGVDCPAWRVLARECSSVAHGQASHGMRGRVLRPAESIAAERVESRRRSEARERRLSALRPIPEAMPF